MSGEGYLSRRASRTRKRYGQASGAAFVPLPAPSDAAAAAPGSLEYNECQQAVKRLNEYLSHELHSEEAAMVQEHLSKCEGCFSRFHFEETLLHTIRERVQAIHAPADLRRNLMDLLKKQESGVSEGSAADTSLPPDGISSED